MFLPSISLSSCPSLGAWRRFFLSVLHRWAAGALFCALVCLLSACAPQTQVTAPDQELFASVSAKMRNQAVEYEHKGELRHALLHWKILQNLNPKDREVDAKVAKLQEEIRAKAADHFNKGVAFYQKNQLAAARREFLYTLTYEQDHPEALDYLLNRLHDTVFKIYQAQEGDTCREIAKRFYNDASKEFLINAFNSVGNSCQPTPGTELKLVVLDQDSAKFADAMSQDGVRLLAPDRQKNKGAEDIYPAAEDAGTDTPKVSKGSTKGNERKYSQARELLDQKKYVEALVLLRTIDSNYQDVAKLTGAVEATIQRKADAHYRKGISYYLSEDLDKAIIEWEEVLRLRPDDLKAKKDLLNARRLKEKIKKF